MFDEDLWPPAQPGLFRGLLLAIVLHVLLIGGVVWGIQWQRSAMRDTGSPRPTATSAPTSRPPQQVAQVQTAAAQPRTACPIRPRLATAGDKDGQLLPPASVAGKSEKDIEAMLVAGKEAAAAGQARDAEVALLTSCRIADAVKGPGSIESANARYQLAHHYLAVASAASAAPVAERIDIFGQAQALYEDSLQRYRTEWGDTNEKTRFAADGLNAARIAAEQTAQPAPEAEVSTARMGAAPASAPSSEGARPATTVTAAKTFKTTPSFDCAKARSWAERTICSDPELAQLDRDLSGLHARAKQAAASPAAFKRQNDAEWKRREKSCRDRRCLVRWYAERRQQLVQSLSQSPSPQSGRTAAR